MAGVKWQLHSFLTWTLVSFRFCSPLPPSGTQWTEGYVGLIFSLSSWETKGNNCPYRESNHCSSVVQPFTLIITLSDMLIRGSTLHRPCFSLRCHQAILWSVRFYVSWYSLTILQVVTVSFFCWQLSFVISRLYSASDMRGRLQGLWKYDTRADRKRKRIFVTKWWPYIRISCEHYALYGLCKRKLPSIISASEARP
jgi:hypothetical protein